MNAHRRIQTIFLILALLALPLCVAGCSGPESANASTDSSSGADSKDGAATPASQEKDVEGKADEEKDKDEKDKEEAVPVEVSELELGPIESVLRFSSNLEAENEVQVFSQASRLVTELLVEEGDHVREGQVLLRLQDDEQRSALAKAESQLAKARREYTQQQRLYEQELISEQAYNDATYELDQLKLAFSDAQRELTYTEVKAPIEGTITQRLVNLGDLVQINQHLFDLVDFDSIVARVYVPEKYVPELNSGQPARVSSQAAGEQAYLTKIKRIAPVIDPKSGTVKVTVEVGRRQGLRPGMYVDVELVTATHDAAVLVPKRAVVYDNDQMFVYRLKDGRRVERVFIEPLLTDKFHIEPLDGLEVGERIVVAGQAGLKDGALVKLPEDDKAAELDATPATTERASL